MKKPSCMAMRSTKQKTRRSHANANTKRLRWNYSDVPCPKWFISAPFQAVTSFASNSKYFWCPIKRSQALLHFKRSQALLWFFILWSDPPPLRYISRFLERYKNSEESIGFKIVFLWFKSKWWKIPKLC